MEEAEKRPKLIERLRDSINMSLGFALYMRNMTSELQIFTEVEMTTLGKLVNDSVVGMGVCSSISDYTTEFVLKSCTCQPAVSS